jgi:hypothetical protein
VDVPNCSEHRRSEVVRAGWYGRPGQRRQRWWCRPVDGSAAHRFTEALPRITDGGGNGHACDECATALEPWEGQPAPRLYGFTARDVAAALVMVARGQSYRRTAAAIRTAAGRPLDTTPRRRSSSGQILAPANEHAQLISDWVEVFAPVIWAAHAPARWPAWLLIDDTQFRVTKAGSARGESAFSVLGAVGYGPGQRPQLVAIEAVPVVDSAAWLGLLRSLKGTPTLIVGDGGPPLASALRVFGRRRPAPELRRCQWHLARNLTLSLPQDVQRDRSDDIHRLIERSLTSVEAWQRLVIEITARTAGGGYIGALKMVTGLDPVVRGQLAQPPSGPRSVGPLEQFFAELDATLGPRASTMTNKVRADALLKLLAADRNGWTDERRWAELVRTHLQRLQGRPRDQRTHTDPAGSPSLRRPPLPPIPIDV